MSKNDEPSMSEILKDKVEVRYAPLTQTIKFHDHIRIEDGLIKFVEDPDKDSTAGEKRKAPEDDNIFAPKPKRSMNKPLNYDVFAKRAAG